jgi:cytochrome b561
MIAHIALYIAMFGMPLTGWLMSSAGGHLVSFFGIPVPSLMDKDPDFGKLMNQIHRITSYVLIGAILFHAAGALKHHFIDGDNTLKRMAAAPMKKIGPYVIIVLLGLFAGAVVKFLFLS